MREAPSTTKEWLRSGVLFEDNPSGSWIELECHSVMAGR
jgi:hypothetical protein